MKRTLDMVILLLLLLLIAVNSGTLLGTPLSGSRDEADSTAAESPVVSLDEARLAFPQASMLGEPRDGVYEVTGNNGALGFVMKSSPYSDRIIGFMGPTPLLIALGTDGRIAKVLALENKESAQYFGVATGSGLLSAWDGLSPEEAVAKEVDAVSGATYSSRAVISSLRARMSAVGSVESHQAKSADWSALLRDAVLVLLVLVSLVAYFRPSLVGKRRRWLLAACILVLGIWQGRMLSVAQFTTWVYGGIPVVAQWAVVMVFALSVVLPMIFGKAYYCAWLCPMGAAQTLLGEVNKKHKLRLSPRLIGWLTLLRSAILFGGLLTIGIGLSFDFADYEAFAVFHPQSAPLVALVIGIVSLVLSVWIPRPWCRFLCPLGEMLELVRKKQQTAK